MKVSDIKVERISTRETKDALGRRVREKYPIQVKRKVITTTPGMRFLHYLIDSLILGGIIYLLSFAGIKLYTSSFRTGNEIAISYYFNAGTMLLAFLYYAVMEVTAGRTFGKMVTGSYVINEYAEKISWSDGLVRTLIRYVPFEAFSCLGDRG